jgi:Fur family peroxide stress response transcriptional regulator
MPTVRKYSRKRDALLHKLCSTTCHPSAVWIYEEVRKDIPDLSLGTVYRNLSVFKDEGLVVSVGTVNGQERYDGNTEEHTHFICLDCGDVIDVDAEIDPALSAAVERTGDLEVSYTQLTLYGKCGKCLAKMNPASAG